MNSQWTAMHINQPTHTFVRNQTFKHLWNKVANFCQTTKSQVVTKFNVTEPRLHCILSLCHIVESTQYKKLVPNALRFIYQNLKSCKITWKNKTKNIRLLVFNFSWIDLVLWSFFFSFYEVCNISNSNMQGEPQSIWHKFLLLSWLYKPSE